MWKPAILQSIAMLMVGMRTVTLEVSELIIYNQALTDLGDSNRGGYLRYVLMETMGTTLSRSSCPNILRWYGIILYFRLNFTGPSL